MAGANHKPYLFWIAAAVIAGALAWGAGSFAWRSAVWQAVPARSSAVNGAVNSVSLLIPMFIYDLHSYPCCLLVPGTWGSANS